MQERPGLDDEVHVLVAPLPEGQGVLGARLPGGPFEHVVGPEEGHLHRVALQPRMGPEQIVACPLGDAHDGVGLPVADGVAGAAHQASLRGELLGTEFVSEVQHDDGPGAGQRADGGGGDDPEHDVGPELTAELRHGEVLGPESADERLAPEPNGVHRHRRREMELRVRTGDEVDFVFAAELVPPLQKVLDDDAQAGPPDRNGVDHHAHRMTVIRRRAPSPHSNKRSER